LTLTAVKCAHYLVQRISPGQLRIAQYVPILTQNARLRSEADEAKQSVRVLLERIRLDGEKAQREEEFLLHEIDFWRRMENLARREVWRKDDALRRTESLLEAQYAQLQALEFQFGESLLLAQQRESALLEERNNGHVLLEAARAELSDLQRTLGPSDTHSDAEVVQMIRNLNLEISRTATLLTDSFHVEDSRQVETFPGAYERTKEAVGPIMAELLESIHHEDDPILVHIALQADMVGFAAGIVSAWDFQHQSNATFSGIHKQMLKTETQSVTGRWRALTRQYSKQRLYNGRDLAAGFIKQLAERLSDILLVSGALADPEQLRQSLYQNFDSIIRFALNLQEIIGERIISRDLEVVVVRIDDTFDPDQMEDVYGDDGPRSEEQADLHVLCTAALGLRRCEKPIDGLGDELQLTTLVKPKVVLETFVYELGLVDEEEIHVDEGHLPA